MANGAGAGEEKYSSAMSAVAGASTAAAEAPFMSLAAQRNLQMREHYLPLLALASADERGPYDEREVFARISTMNTPEDARDVFLYVLHGAGFTDYENVQNTIRQKIATLPPSSNPRDPHIVALQVCLKLFNTIRIYDILRFFERDFELSLVPYAFKKPKAIEKLAVLERRDEYLARTLENLAQNIQAIQESADETERSYQETLFILNLFLVYYYKVFLPQEARKEAFYTEKQLASKAEKPNLETLFIRQSNEQIRYYVQFFPVLSQEFWAGRDISTFIFFIQDLLNTILEKDFSREPEEVRQLQYQNIKGFQVMDKILRDINRLFHMKAIKTVQKQVVNESRQLFLKEGSVKFPDLDKLFTLALEHVRKGEEPRSLLEARAKAERAAEAAAREDAAAKMAEAKAAKAAASAAQKEAARKQREAAATAEAEAARTAQIYSEEELAQRTEAAEEAGRAAASGAEAIREQLGGLVPPDKLRRMIQAFNRHIREQQEREAAEREAEVEARRQARARAEAEAAAAEAAKEERMRQIQIALVKQTRESYPKLNFFTAQALLRVIFNSLGEDHEARLAAIEVLSHRGPIPVVAFLESKGLSPETVVESAMKDIKTPFNTTTTNTRAFREMMTTFVREGLAKPIYLRFQFEEGKPLSYIFLQNTENPDQKKDFIQYHLTAEREPLPGRPAGSQGSHFSNYYFRNVSYPQIRNILKTQPEEPSYNRVAHIYYNPNTSYRASGFSARGGGKGGRRHRKTKRRTTKRRTTRRRSS